MPAKRMSDGNFGVRVEGLDGYGCGGDIIINQTFNIEGGAGRQGGSGFSEEQMEQSIRAIVIKELTTQSRAGGMLRK